MGEYIETLDESDGWQEKFLKDADIEHPLDPKRSFLKDLNAKVEDYRKRLEKAGHDPNGLFTADVQRMLRDLSQEY